VNPRAASIAVIVVTYNSAQLLADLIDSLPAGLMGCDWQLIIVDNASADDTLAEANRLAPAATVVQTGRNAGYAAGINAGVAAAGAYDYLLVLNPDVRLLPGCAAGLIQAAGQPGVGLAVPRLVDRRGNRIDTQRREPSIVRTLADAALGARRAGRIGTLGETVSDEASYLRETATAWAEGSTILITRACWLACGPWEESFFLYSEETEFALRARDRGYATWYTPQAQAIHLEGDSAQSPALWALLNLNRVRLYRLRHGLAASAVYWAVLTVRELSRALLGKPTSRAAARALLRPSVLRAERGPHLLSMLA
jgi:N-acetylglucosaminyl-diphospho-decaprenol L-rhamnosyltransferase